MSRIRIVVADQAEAVFYDAASPAARPREVAHLKDPAAHRHERDFVSDRPGRTHAPMGRGARHAFGPEPHVRRAEAEKFARDIASRLETERQHEEWDELVLIAGSRFLGTLRRELARGTADRLAQTVARDLVHSPAREMQDSLRETLDRLQAR